MYSFTASSPTFTSQASIVAPPRIQKTQAEIVKEKVSDQAKEALKKDASQRNVSDYFAIGMNTVNNIVDNAPVVHANNVPKLNYLA